MPQNGLAQAQVFFQDQTESLQSSHVESVRKRVGCILLRSRVLL